VLAIAWLPVLIIPLVRNLHGAIALTLEAPTLRTHVDGSDWRQHSGTYATRWACEPGSRPSLPTRNPGP